MYEQVLFFWFQEIKPKMWWRKDPSFDSLIAERFGALHHQANAGELSSWRTTSRGSLAEVIILDQFSRNIYRGQRESFSSDPLALELSELAIEKGFDLELIPVERSFFYMPFMHSESLLVHEKAEALFRHLGINANLQSELRHKAVLARFGRYPHRNEILGRVSSAEELAFLQQPNSRF